jgi:hypothetical protein
MYRTILSLVTASISPRKSRTTRRRVTGPGPVDAIGPITGFPGAYEQAPASRNACCISERKYRTP